MRCGFLIPVPKEEYRQRRGGGAKRMCLREKKGDGRMVKKGQARKKSPWLKLAVILAMLITCSICHVQRLTQCFFM